MGIALLGSGAISCFVVKKLAAHGIDTQAVLLRNQNICADDLCVDRAVPLVYKVDDLPTGISLLVDCAGHSGLLQHGIAALEAGIDVLTLSVGALADASFYDQLEKAACRGGARLHLASGAIGGLDALRALAVDDISRVTYTGRKPPKGWRGSVAEKVIDLSRDLSAPFIHFSGTARQAALLYPKNANVAAAVALAGIGFERTQVELIADPSVTMNMHEIEVEGRFGQMKFSISAASLPDNPKSSALAAMSVVAAILEYKKPIKF